MPLTTPNIVSISAGTTNATARQVVFGDANGVTFGANGATVTASVNAGGGGLSLQDGATTLNVTKLVVSNANGLTFGLNTAANVATLTGSYTRPVVSNALQDVGTATGSGTNTSRFAADDHVHRGVAGIDVNGVASTFYGTVQLSAGNLMSVATGGVSTRGSMQFVNLLSSATTVSSVGSANAVGAMASRFALEGHVHGGVGAFGVSNTGTTAGNTGTSHGTWVLGASGNVTASMSTGAAGVHTAWISVPVAGAGGGASIGVNGGATSTGAVQLSNSNGITFGGNASTVTASHDGLRSVQDGATTLNVSKLVFANSNGVTFGLSTAAGVATVTASVNAGGGGAPTISQWPYEYMSSGQTATANTGASAATGGSTQWTYSGTVWSQPFPHQLEYSFVNALASIAATSAGTGSVTVGVALGIYTLNANTALSRLSSFQFVHEMSQSSVTARTHRFYWGTNSTSNSTQAAGNSSASFTGLRMFPLYAANGTLSASNYYFVMFHTQRTAGISAFGHISLPYWSGSSTGAMCLGQNTTGPPLGGFGGVFSTTTNTNVITGAGLPASIHTSAITRTGNISQWRFPVFYMHRSQS